jgi:uncharacterized protein
VIVVEVAPGGEVLETVARQAERHGIRDAAIVSLIGAVESARISTMPKGDPASDVLSDYEQPMELSGTGELVNGLPHIHCVLGVEGDTALAGHLHQARVGTHFVRAYLIPTGA